MDFQFTLDLAKVPPHLSFSDFSGQNAPFIFLLRNNTMHTKANNQHIQAKSQRTCILFMGEPDSRCCSPCCQSDTENRAGIHCISRCQYSSAQNNTVDLVFQVSNYARPSRLVSVFRAEGWLQPKSANKQEGSFCHNYQLLTSWPTLPFSMIQTEIFACFNKLIFNFYYIIIIINIF